MREGYSLQAKEYPSRALPKNAALHISFLSSIG